MTFGRRFLGTLSASALIALIGLASGVVAARFLGPTSRGELAAILLWPTILFPIAVAGLYDAVTYFCARDRQSAGKYSASALGVGTLTSIIVSGALWLLLPVLLSSQSEGVVASSRWFVCYLLLSPLLLPSAALRGLGRITQWNLIRVVQPLVWLASVVSVAIVGIQSPSAMATVYLAALIPVMIAICLLVMRSLPGLRSLESRAISSLIKYGIPNAVADLPAIVNLRLDQVVIAAALPPRDLGLYAVAVAWSAMPRTVTHAYGAILMPTIAQGRKDQVALLGASMRIAVLLASVLAVMQLIITPIGIRVVFGGDFEGAIPAAQILVVASAFWTYSATLRDATRGLGRPSIAAIAELVAVPVTVGVLAATLGHFGILGAAFASLAGYSTSSVVSLLLIGRITGAPVSTLLIPRVSDVRRAVSELGAARSMLTRRRQ